MNRDPFDALRARNPVPPQSLPDAPLPVAAAITRRPASVRRGLAISLAAAALVLAGGGAWLLWSRPGGQETAVEVTATTVAGIDTTAAPTSDIALGEDVPVLVVYFLTDDGTLVPVARDLAVLNVRPLPASAPLAIDLLLFGPGAWDAAPLPGPVARAEAELHSAIPAGTTLRSITLTDGVAVVDLSAEFAAAPPAALAQVVFTATRLEGADGVRFVVEGQPYRLDEATLSLVLSDSPDETAPVEREAFAEAVPPLLAPVMIESPALGATLSLPGSISGSTSLREGSVLLHFVNEAGEIVWQATAPIPCLGCAAGAFSLPIEADLGTGWVSVQAYLSSFDQGPFTDQWVWPAPTPPAEEEPSLPEAEAATTTTTTSTTLAGDAAPWEGSTLAAETLPAVALDTWLAADDPPQCPLLFPDDPASLAAGAVLHDRYFGGGWGLAWDLPSGPGRWEPGGDYCADCGREAFGVAGTGLSHTGDEQAPWSNQLAWRDGSAAGYGYEGFAPSNAGGEPLLAYLSVAGTDCLYNVWSYLGEDHLLALIDSLRLVTGAP